MRLIQLALMMNLNPLRNKKAEKKRRDTNLLEYIIIEKAGKKCAHSYTEPNPMMTMRKLTVEINKKKVLFETQI